ncbi:excinuclease ABC subunit UvrC [Candidatus Tisiphia endosymbiont of Melanophora roralis]|jgi:excinuclease ABC subunit C|uniref:excinuclease ABC subunit UvrC n=1 Tax=Candidatus Tisiphia endosymbiont of Melanophora roralis TaxID=3066261 RepID=UPI001E7B67C8|nr:MAG: excinuclease ABC subunit UvrC [Rickettsia endosymbiont of Cimex lectularius]
MLQKSKLIGSELIKSHLENAPNLPGVYKMLGADQQVIYVGKAKNLKKRLTNYIKTDLDNKTIRMVSLTHHLEYNVTNSEIEALLLEAQLIKKFQPKFNILLKDDKSFPYVKLRLDTDYPQLIKYRGKNLSSGEFFGPFVSSEQVDTTLKELQKIFKLRSCSDNYFKNRKRPCLQYQIGRCSAPCVGKISKADYSELVSQVRDFLTGKTKELQKTLSDKMEQLSLQLRFEAAAEIRDRIKALSYIQLKSTLSSSSIKNADIIAIVEKNNCYCIQLFVYRFGQSYGNIAYFPFQTDESNKAEILTQFINQFYQTNPVPDEIIINHPIIDLELVTKAIKQLSGNNKLSIIHPIRGNKVKLLENAELNGQLALDQHLKQFAKNQMIFQQIQQLFNLPLLPDRIEVYDNSHIMGTFAVGSMIVATKSGFDKKEYRIFNIPVAKGDAKGGDDYEMLRTVLTRRFTRLKKEHPKSIYSNDLENGDNKQGVSELGVHEVREYANTPQVFAKTNSSKQKSIVSLMIIDGGKGHLSVVQKIMAEFGLAIPFVCMSKGPDRNAGCEQFHMLGKEAFTINKNLPVMKYLQILRDEAHNFAIKNHRLRRSKAIKVSSLDDINSVGLIRKKALLHYFGSYKTICDATIEELSKVKGISKTLAKHIFTSLHNK